MEWTSNAIVLGNRPHGETHSVARVFSETHGAVSGLVHGGQGRSRGPIVQPGNGVQARWRGRTDDQLGHFELELTEPRAAVAMASRKALLGLTAVTDLLYRVLPDSQPMPPLYAATTALLDLLEHEDMWPILLAKWELGVLEKLGFGLTLDRCAATGRHLEDGATLTFVSPKSGCAVSYEAGLPYKDRMLPLAPFLIDQGDPTIGDVRSALKMTAFFLRDRVLGPANLELPDARDRLISRLT